MLSKFLVILCTLLALCFNTKATVPSPRATADLICHTSHASECYSRTFQPTESFQIVHDDQELPPGLHIRLNIATGKKEAKLNVVGEDEQALMATTAMDVAVVDSPSSPLEAPGIQNSAQKVVKGDQGSIRPPPPNSPEGISFDSSGTSFKTARSDKPQVILSALETLEDLSHDIYWGLKLAQDSDIVPKLVKLLSINGSDPHIKGAAALVLGTAIRNNPAAFTAAISHFYNDEQPTGPMEAVIVALVHEQLPQLLTRFVYLLSALCQDEAYLWKFVNGDGLDVLMTAFSADKAGQDGRDRLRGKIANFILDHFLQQDSFDMSEKKHENSRQTSESEVDSNLEHEDAWVLPYTDEGVYELPRNMKSQPKYRNMADILKPWCAVFSQSLSSWEKWQGIFAPADEVDNVQEAHKALEEKLKSFGCGCEKDCGTPRMEL
ncbi:hypothetical protein MMC30_003356 [Trapelia coarctata]|nr:hypothetical protein [Trapelia coarctata]